MAGSYRLVLDPSSGKYLRGHAGVEAVDQRTPIALVRVISPGNEIAQRGTVRVLVMNLGAKPFEFGPDQVQLKLVDGRVLSPTSVDAMEKGRTLVERESRYAGAIDLQNRQNLAGMEQQANGGPTAQSMSPGGNTSSDTTSGSGDYDHRTDQSLLPGAGTLNAIYQILVEQPVAPQKAWGGYYVFDVPKDVFARRADQPLTILVTTGGEVHKFNATLKWK
jgi:hypothetical protein